MADDSLKSLPEKKQKYLKNRAKGMSKKDAAIKAGYAPTTATAVATHIETPDVKAAFRQAIEKYAPYEKVAQRIGEGLDATETKFFAHKGKIEDSADVINVSERRQYAELAAQMGDYWTPKVQNQVGVFVVAPPAEQIAAVFGSLPPSMDEA